MYRLLLLTLLLLVCAACGTISAAQAPIPSANTLRSSVARNEHTTDVPTVVVGARLPTRVPSHTVSLASPTPLADVIYLPMPTAAPPIPRRPTAIGGIRAPLSSAQQVIAALQAAGLTITVKEAPHHSGQAGQDAGFEYATVTLESGGQRFDVGITMCPSKQACDDGYALGYKLALDGHAQIWRSPDGLILCMTVPPAPITSAITMKEVIEAE